MCTGNLQIWGLTMCLVCRRNALLMSALLALHNLYHCFCLTSYHAYCSCCNHSNLPAYQTLQLSSSCSSQKQTLQLKDRPHSCDLSQRSSICLLYGAFNLSGSDAMTGCRRPNCCSFGARSCKKHRWILKGQEGSVGPSGA